ncbi:hypothetical protein SAAV_0478 [Staphylococcus aureus subsp. aureus ED98]|nr:hypothetical protein SAAV_0478 [Staphylococcus aureus subsp. aureus ED98]
MSKREPKKRKEASDCHKSRKVLSEDGSQLTFR